MALTNRATLKAGSSGIASASVLMLAVLAAPAAAQATPEEGAAPVEDNVIIVTAQKREQSVLDVPVAVSAIGEDTLEAAQVNDFADLTSVAPSLTITGSGNKNQNVVSLRGIGTSSFSTAVEPSVLVVVDDVALLQPGQAFGNLTDLARVEVLRGPQGTLFGKNASAGVINIATKDPTAYFTGYAQATATTDEEYRFDAMLSGPISDGVGFRLNGYYSDYEGYLTNLTNDSTLGAEETWGIRGKLNADLGAIELGFIADYSESSGNGGIDTYRRLDQVDGNGNPINQGFDLTGVRPGPENRTVTINDENVNDTDQLLLAGKADWDLGFATLSSVSSYQSWNYYAENDQDFTSQPTIFQMSPYAAEQFSQELRLTSPTSGVFDYMVGLYFSEGSTDRSFERETAPFLAFLRQDWESEASTTSYAAFAQLGYDITPSTLLTGGARINREEISVRFVDNRSTPATVYEGDTGETAVTWRLALQQFIGDDLMAFGSVSTGYKGQAYDISSGFDQRRADNPIESEDSINYELGLSGRYLGGTGQFQLVAFWSEYDNFQAQGINNSLVIPQFELTNVGKLRTRGIEFETSIQPTEGLTLFGSAAYVDSTIREFPDAECYPEQTVAEGCVFDPGIGDFTQDLAGKPLNNSPDFKFNVGFDFETPVSQGANFFVNGNYTWQDDVNFALTTNPRTVQPADGRANLAVGVGSMNDKWRVSLFVNNLFDQDYVTRIIDDTGRDDPFILLQQVPRNAERFGGIRLRLGF